VRRGELFTAAYWSRVEALLSVPRVTLTQYHTRDIPHTRIACFQALITAGAFLVDICRHGYAFVSFYKGYMARAILYSMREVIG
jgi:hypothetical protein